MIGGFGHGRPLRGLLLLVLAAVTVGVLVLAAQRDPWDPDETRYLQITHEMLASGNPFLMTLNGEPYSDKPPLIFWVMAPFVAVFGHTSALAGLMPSLISYLLLPLAIGALARSADLHPEVATWGSIITASSLLPALLAGGCRMDLTFTLLCVLALASLIRAVKGDTAHRRLFWVWVALGVLTKGPLALGLPLLALIPLLPKCGRAVLRAFRPSGLLIALLIVAAWLVPAALLGGADWFLSAVVYQTTGRMVSSFAHQEPWWYHFATVPLALLPWSPAILVGLVRLCLQKDAVRIPARLLVYYPITTIVFLSLLSGKTLLYPLPLFPVAALVAAWWLVHGDRLPVRLVLGVGGAAGIALAAGLFLFVAPHPDFRLIGVGAWILAGSVGFPALVAALAAIIDELDASAQALAMTIPLFAAFGLPLVGQGFDRLLSLRPFGQAYDALAPPGAGYAFDKLQPGFLLFTGRPFHLLDSDRALLEALDAGRLIAVDEDALERVAGRIGRPWDVAAAVPYRHSTILLIQAPAGRVTPAPHASPGATGSER